MKKGAQKSQNCFYEYKGLIVQNTDSLVLMAFRQT